MAFQLLKSDGNSSTWADPASPETTFRLKQTSSNKVIGSGIPVSNHITEVIVSSKGAVVVDGQNAVDTHSVRLRVSGALESAAALQTLVGLLANTVTTLWGSQYWLEGFTPSTVPAPAV